MDVATHFLQWKERPPEEWARAANRYLPHIVSALLIIAPDEPARIDGLARDIEACGLTLLHLQPCFAHHCF